MVGGREDLWRKKETRCKGEGNRSSGTSWLGCCFCTAQKQQANLPPPPPCPALHYSNSLMHASIHLPSPSRSRRMGCCVGYRISRMTIKFISGVLILTWLVFHQCIRPECVFLFAFQEKWGVLTLKKKKKKRKASRWLALLS